MTDPAQWSDDAIVAMLQTPFALSPYQLGAYRHVLAGKQDGLINAVAGSGKTTTIIHAAKLAASQGKSWSFVAFGHAIMVEINDRLAHEGMRKNARTAHQLGKIALLKHLGRQGKHLQDPSDKKYRGVIRNFVNGVVRPTTKMDDAHAFSTLSELCNLARLTLTPIGDVHALVAMAEHFSIDLVAAVSRDGMPLDEIDARNREEKRLRTQTLRGVQLIIEEADQIAERTGLIDFADMLWLPHQWGLTPFQSDLTLCDECQDLSAVQLDLVQKLRKPRGMLMFVGDPAQAIFGFSGADNESFWRIAEVTQAVQLPLSISYRCPQSHVRLAQTIVPQIEARANAPEGIIETISQESVAERVREQTDRCLIICRTTAPLVELCLKLIAKHINARVRGREIGTQLLNMIDDVATQPGFRWEQFGRWLDVYEAAQIDRLSQRDDNASQIQALTDRVAAIKACFENFTPDEVASLDTFKAALLALFTETNPGVWLSTVHRAKGLEAEFIYLLHPEKMPLIWNGQQDWELQQEMNLKYVALSRSTHALYFVRDTVANNVENEEEALAKGTLPIATPAQDIAAILADLDRLQQTFAEFGRRGKLTPRTAQELLDQIAPLRAKLLALADTIGA